MAELRRYSSCASDKSKRRVSIMIDANNKVWAPSDRRRSSGRSLKSFQSDSTKKDTLGVINPTFVEEEEQMHEVHLGHNKEMRKKSIRYLKKELEIDYHIVPLTSLYNRFNSNPDSGMSEESIKGSIEEYGKNILTPPKTTPLWIKFITTLLGGFQLLLWAGSILSFAAYIAQCVTMKEPPLDNLYMGIVLAFVVIVLGVFTFYQEYSSGKVMDSFTKMVPSFASTIRNGELKIINATELVVGDIVEVKFGDCIPADLRIIKCSGFKVDNSSLTGESEPQVRSIECTDENPMETKNLAFFSTNALEGTAKGIVVAIGDNTFIGRIAGLASGLDKLDTPLSKEISHFIKLLSSVAAFFGVTFSGAALFLGYSWIDAALFLIGIIVANVPEGLLVTFTVVLALTAKRMANKNCLVKQLHAVETLGSTTTICSDKTGTLTQNKMTVSHCYYSDTIVNALSEPSEIQNNDPGFEALSRVARLCLRAKFLPNQDDIPIPQRKIQGDASESAILRSMEINMPNVEKYQERNNKVFEIPFNSTNKYQVSVHELEDNPGQLLLVMKGAPERIINYCKKIVVGGEELDMDEDWTYRFNVVCEEIAEMGERVIGLCDLMLPVDKYPPGYAFNSDDDSFLKLGLRFVGLVSMIDPPRPGVPEAVKICREAGIKVVMVTGDHPITAKAIAKGVGIISEGSETVEDIAKRTGQDVDTIDPWKAKAVVVNGTTLLEMSTSELDETLKMHTEIVFARVSPQQKLIIVEAFQRLNNIVAVTGDGVNDSPALKKADIGIAMGISGSDVSKQAADMILMDDNFISIVSGVEEGRLIFENLKKCIGYLLAANIAELCPFLVLIIFRIPLALGTIPMIFICLGTDIVPTISLSYEKAEGDIMKKAPRDAAKEKLVTGRLIGYAYGNIGIIESYAGFFTYFVVMGQNGWKLPRLLGLADQWDSTHINDLKDSYEQEWTYSQRKRLEHTCWTAYFCAVVVTQWGNVLVMKCRRASLLTKFFDNWVVFFGIFFMTCLACFLSYTPYLNTAISYMPIKFVWWLPGLPFTLLIIVYDETRRFIIRNFPKLTWYCKEFYY